jgi:hypothetical protein
MAGDQIAKLSDSAKATVATIRGKLDELLGPGAARVDDVAAAAGRPFARLGFAELTEGLARATGREAVQYADEIALRSTHTAGNVDRVVLGKYPGYINEARANGGTWYETPADFFANLTSHAGDEASEKAWLVNESFLRQQLASGINRIEFTTEGLQHARLNPGSFSARERNFLNSNASDFGYIRDGAAWILK